MNKINKRLYLIDGANYAFRAFYAIRNLSNSKGMPTGALLGFAQMMVKLIREEKPDLAAVCFDTPEPTFRDEMYEDYKANRPEPPDDLVPQFPFFRPVAEVLGLPVLEKPGFEADDVIGTLAKRFSSRGFDVVIVSGDKDLMQLVGPGVTILDEMKERRIGPREVEERFGVGPEGVVEVLGLAGDSSDNIPGVSGVGPKTAAELIRRYGTVENVIAHAAELKGALSGRISEGAEKARLSRRLVQIDTAVDIEADEKTLAPRGTDVEKARALFKELEFKRLLAELAPPETLSRGKYGLTRDAKELRSLLASAKKLRRVSLAVEGSSPDPMRAEVTGFALCLFSGEASCVPVGGAMAGQSGELFGPKFSPGGATAEEALVSLSELLSEAGVEKVGHNLNRDLTILSRLGQKVAGPLFDAMLASYVLDPGEDHDLESLAQKYLDHRMLSVREPTGGGRARKGAAEADPKGAFLPACEQADVALRLAELLKKRIEEEKLTDVYYGIEIPLLPVLVSMQTAGMRVDAGKLSALAVDFGEKLGNLEKRIFKEAGCEFNVASPKQLGEVLFGKLGLPGAKKTKTGFSTSQDILEELAASHPLPGLVLEHRSLAKLKGTYVDALPELINPATGRIHTSFNQAVAATGRLSSSDPNLQNIPARSEEGRRIREAFVAEEGFLLVSADYSQIELRVLAHMSGEPELLRAFEKGEDVHAITASGIFGVSPAKVTNEQRAVGKTVNFATIYGQGAFGLSKQLGIEVGEAARYIDNYFKKYPGVAAYRDGVIEEARRTGLVKTLFGRRRFIPDIESRNSMLRAVAERTAFNTVFQGTAADIIKRAMISVHAGLAAVSKRAKLIMQVHDELVVEAPEGEAEAVGRFLSKEMEGAAGLSVPLVADVGVAPNWAKAH